MHGTADATRKDTLSGLLRVALAGVAWGTIPLVIRAADGASVIKVFYRVFFAGIAVFLYMLAKGRLREIYALPRRKLFQIGVQGALLTLNWVLFLTALDLTSVATAELLAYTGPVFVAALAPFVTGERFDRRIIAPILLSLGGIAVILAPQGLAVASPRQLLGAGLAFASALTYAALLLRSKKILRGVTAPALMVVEYTVASLLVLPAVAYFYAHGQGPSTGRAYAALLTLGIVHSAIVGMIFLAGLRKVRTDHAAVLMYAEPVSAVLFAAAFLGERLTVWTVLGGAMVVAGGLVVARLEPTFGPDAPSPGDDGMSAESSAADCHSSTTADGASPGVG